MSDEQANEQAELEANSADAGSFDLSMLDSLILSPGPEVRGSHPRGVTQVLTFETVRELTLADLALLGNGRTVMAQPFPDRLANITHRHHSAARLLADGEQPQTVAYATGYSLQTIYNLQLDPAFRDLVAHYGEQKAQVYLDVHSRLGALGMTAIEELQRRLDRLESIGLDDAEDEIDARRRAAMPNKEIREIAQLALDRSVAPAKFARAPGQGEGGNGATAGLTVNLNFGEAPRGGSAGAASGAVIEGELVGTIQLKREGEPDR